MDAKAVKILFNAFWSSAGWHQGGRIAPSAADYLYAKQRGVMFDPDERNHDQLVDDMVRLVAAIDRRKVADAFLASLSTRRLDWRSALGSYAVFQHFAVHSARSVDNERHCAVCGHYLSQAVQDVNVFSFERIKWGGVRHDGLHYAVFDLGQFAAATVPSPTPSDVRIFKDLLAAIDAAPVETTSAALHTVFAKCLKSNKSERNVLIAILGFCGILGTNEHPGYSDRFVPTRARVLPDRHFVDMSYPACWCRRNDGVNRAMLAEYFGHVL